jgi:hypothetical protein
MTSPRRVVVNRPRSSLSSSRIAACPVRAGLSRASRSSQVIGGRSAGCHRRFSGRRQTHHEAAPGSGIVARAPPPGLPAGCLCLCAGGAHGERHGVTIPSGRGGHRHSVSSGTHRGGRSPCRGPRRGLMDWRRIPCQTHGEWRSRSRRTGVG